MLSIATGGAFRILPADGSPDIWTFIGPQPAAGRVTAIAVNPGDPDVAYLGSAGGGVWKTTDGGLHWTPTTDDQASLSIGSVALDPSDPNVIYAGTGEINACETCYTGAGILKSSDAGNSWKQLKGPFLDTLGRGARIGSISVNPSDGNIILAAAYFVGAAGVGGVYRSTDGGDSWTAVITENQGTTVAFAAGDSNVAYASLFAAGIFKSSDAGKSWTRIDGSGEFSLPVDLGGRIDMAVAASSPGTLYAAIANADPSGEGGTLGVYKTADAGQTWARLDNLTDYCKPQCGYNSVIATDPTDADLVYVGGVDLYRTSDGGQTWKSIRRGGGSAILPSYQHAIAIASDSSRIYVGNDGGAYAGGNPAATVSWSNLNSTLGIAQFHGGLSIHPADAKIAFGGAQGAGIQMYTGNLGWQTAICRDGGDTVLDSANPSNVYVSCQGTQIQKSENGGASWSLALNGIDPADRVQATPPLIGDPVRSQRLYFGTYRIYQSNDGAGSWTPISPDLTGGASTLTTIAVAAGDDNVVYAGTGDGHVQVTANASDGPSVFWTDLSGGLPARAVSKMVVDAGNSFGAYASFLGYGTGRETGHVFHIENFTRGWVDATGDLPNGPVNDIVLDPDMTGTLYAATDTGVFRTTDAGAHWLALAGGLPNVVVKGLTLHRPSRILRAATQGRGVWDLSVPLPEGSNGAPALASLSPRQAEPGGASLTVVVDGMGFIPGSAARWNGRERPTARVSATELRVELSRDDLGTPGLSQLTVVNPAPGGGVSNALDFAVAAAPYIAPGSVVDAAGFQARPVAPGSLVTLFGKNLAFSDVAASSVPLPVSLGGTVLRLGGIATPLLFAGAGQITFQVPWELSGLDSVSVNPSVAGVAGNSQSVRLTDFSPGVFTLPNPRNQAAVLIANTTVIAAPSSLAGARPAMRGEVVSIFCTGLGDVSHRPGSGMPAAFNPLSVTFATPAVRIGDSVASTAFAGLAPGLVGTYIVNVRIPDDASTGDAVPIVVSVGTNRSNTATMAIQ